MTPLPTALKLNENGDLQIAWDDGRTREYTVRQLRNVCPCATCREKRKAPPSATVLPVLSPADMQPLKIVSVEPTGRYAYAIHFSDGHNTGIYTLESLRELGREVASE